MIVPDEIRKCVVFICFKNKNDEFVPGGTGFFVGISLPDLNIVFVYLVTAKHVVVDTQRNSIDGRVYLRINLLEGGFEILQVEENTWRFHPDDGTVDVAVLNLFPDNKIYDYRIYPLDRAVTEDLIQKENIGVGDEVFVTGLFVNHYGKMRNLPILRTGNIALMPEERIAADKFVSVEAYLIESRSTGGLSGSPVFVRKPEIRIKDGEIQFSNITGGVYRWLGLIHGHFDVPIPGEDSVREDSSKSDAVNRGIAIVIPAAKVLEIINHPAYKEGRDKLVEGLRAKKQPPTE